MSPTKLLVSVRNSQEALAAAGLVHVLDIKEPSAGPLGCAGERVITEIVDSVRSNESLAMSAALGELSEWTDREPIRIPPSIHFLKTGLAGELSRTGWRNRWKDLRRRFEDFNGSAFQWIAVGYADSDTAQSPPLPAILDFACTEKCVGLLIDTWKKEGLTLWDHLSWEELRKWTADARSSGLITAIAGRVRLGDVSRVVELNADLVAIRSAACAGGDRTQSIDRPTLERFTNALRAANHAAGHSLPNTQDGGPSSQDFSGICE